MSGYEGMIEDVRFAEDSPLEESGFEPLIPLTLNQANAGEREEIGAGIWRILSKSHRKWQELKNYLMPGSMTNVLHPFRSAG